MSRTLALFSPAKINLFMRVLHKRSDGYHNVATLMQTIGLGDTLTFELADKDHLICTHPAIPCDHRNLIFKAASLFRQKTGLSFGLKVHLEKKIPLEAGLGGGSSNAATTLWALNQLCGQPATLADLKLWSTEIGSDITFFFAQGVAYCTGRGEIIKELAPIYHLQKVPIWVIKPEEGLSTPEIYKSLNLNTCSSLVPEELCNKFYEGDYHLINDLEAPAFEKLPRLKQILELLKGQGFSHRAMSGSGSSLFCFGEYSPQAIPKSTLYKSSFLYRAADSWYTV